MSFDVLGKAVERVEDPCQIKQVLIFGRHVYGTVRWMDHKSFRAVTGFDPKEQTKRVEEEKVFALRQSPLGLG